MPEKRTYPKDTTKEQWDQYELDLANHNAFIKGREEFAAHIFDLVEKEGIYNAKAKIKSELDMAWSMDRPNEPGYYIANND